MNTAFAIVFGVLLSWGIGYSLNAWLHSCPRRVAGMIATALYRWCAMAEITHIRVRPADAIMPVEIQVMDLVATLQLYSEGAHNGAKVT